MSRWGRYAIASVAMVLASAAARAQTVRAPLLSAGDSTVTFDATAMASLRKGWKGMVVDPRNRDALVARIRVLDVQSGIATALVTGQTTTLGPPYVAIFETPKRHFFADPAFWIGSAAGLVIGAALGHR